MVWIIAGCSAEQPHKQVDRVDVEGVTSQAKSSPTPTKPPPVAQNPPPKPEENSPTPDRVWPVKLGVDVLLSSRAELVEGKRVGLITNASAVDGALTLTVDRLIEDKRVNLVQLYSPEHGLTGSMRNGKSDEGETVYVHQGQRIPVQGLTGDRWTPSPETLRGLDVLVFDIQDIGSRTYTYITTLGLAMGAAAKAKVPLVVLDRPNPQGGLRFEGPVRLAKYKSFVGWGPFPVTHGMTVGEVARFYNGELGLGCALTVVQMEGWRREMVWQDTGLDWVPTSPGIPHAINAQLYVATGMVGGSGPNVNEGGGNSMPFELIGALFVEEPKRLAEKLNAAKLPGVYFRPLVYQPWGKQFTNKRVGGVHLMLKDPKVFRPLRTALTILVTLRALYGDALTVKNPRRFGRIWGNDVILPMIFEGKSVEAIEATWASELKAFAGQRSKYLLYGDADR